MQGAFRVLASYVALMCNAGAVVILGVAAIEAFVLLVHAAPRLGDQSVKRRIWVRFASWIVLSLEFALAADIVDTAITPSWTTSASWRPSPRSAPGSTSSWRATSSRSRARSSPVRPQRRGLSHDRAALRPRRPPRHRECPRSARYSGGGGPPPGRG